MQDCFMGCLGCQEKITCDITLFAACLILGYGGKDNCTIEEISEISRVGIYAVKADLKTPFLGNFVEYECEIVYPRNKDFLKKYVESCMKEKVLRDWYEDIVKRFEEKYGVKTDLL